MEDENWLEDIFKDFNDAKEELSATEYIDQWMNGELCDMICEDANKGCEESQKFINDLCLMMDSAVFHMGQAEADHSRIDKELATVIRHIDSVGEE
jgi:hypothetical protein